MSKAFPSVYDGQGWSFAPIDPTYCNPYVPNTYRKRYGRFLIMYGTNYREWRRFGLMVRDSTGLEDYAEYFVGDVLDFTQLSTGKYAIPARSSLPSWASYHGHYVLSLKEQTEFAEAVLADKQKFLKEKRLAAANKLKEEARAQGLSLADYRKKRSAEHKEKLLSCRAQRGQETVEALLKISPHLTQLKEAMARFEKVCTDTSDDLNMKNLEPSIARMNYLTKRINGWTRYRKNRNK